jgi:hypothetical protein
LRESGGRRVEDGEEDPKCAERLGRRSHEPALDHRQPLFRAGVEREPHVWSKRDVAGKPVTGPTVAAAS